MQRRHFVFLPYKLHFRHFLNALAERADVTVLVPPEKTLPEVTKLQGIPIRYYTFGGEFLKRFITSGLRSLKYVPGLHKRLESIEFDALITYEYYHWYTFQALWFKKRHPETQVYLINETKRWPPNVIPRVIKKILFFYFKRIYRRFDKIYTYTDQARVFLEERIPGIEVEMLPTPTNVELFVPNPDKEFLANGTLRLLMNARYSEYKRHGDIFKAIKILNERGVPVVLTCISRELQRRENVVALADEIGVRDVVTFHDPVSQEELLQLNYAHDVLVLPSYNEAIGMVVPEAMACGLPTITTDTVGANVYVDDGVTGIIYPTGDVDALVEAIKHMHLESVLQDMGARANERIRSLFTPDVVVENFLKRN